MSVGQTCACGCGAEIDARRSDALYASDACKSRAWRQRAGYRLQAVREPCQTPEIAAKRDDDSGLGASRASKSAPEVLWRAVALRWPEAPNGWWRGRWCPIREVAQAQANRWTEIYGIEAWIEPNVDILPEAA